MRKSRSAKPVYLSFFIMLSAYIILCPTGGVTQDEGGLQENIEEVNRQIEEKRRELEERERRLQSLEKDERKVLTELERNQKKIEEVNRSLISIRRNERTLRNEINQTEEELKKSTDEIQKQSEEYKQMLRSIYKRRSVSAMQVFFSAGSFSSMMWAMQMLTEVADAELTALENLRNEQESIRAARSKIRTDLDRTQKLANREKRQENTLARSREERRKILNDIEKNKKLNQEIIRQRRREIEAAQARLSNLIQQVDRQKQEETFSVSLKDYDFAGRKGNLPWPVRGRVVEKFGIITDAETKTKTKNSGIEIAAQSGTSVKAIGHGKVLHTDYIRGYGNYVIIIHPGEYYSVYAHLGAIHVQPNDEVKEGSVIGTVGDSPSSGGGGQSSLLLEVRKKASPQNPLLWLGGGV